MPKFVDIANTENEFFKIRELSHSEPRPDRAKCLMYFYRCECKACGNETVVRKEYLRSGHTRSCGCTLKLKGSKHKDWKGVGSLSSSRFSEIAHSAKVRDIDFGIDMGFAWSLFEKQAKKCALTGLDIDMGHGNKNRGTASLDRIDNSKSYTAENVRWVHKDVNLMKRTMSDEQLFQYCELILLHRKSK